MPCMHAVNTPCVMPVRESAIPPVCTRCNAALLEHSDGRCAACNQVFASHSDCEPVYADSRSDVGKSVCPQCTLFSFPHPYCLCQFCGLVHSTARDCRRVRVPALFRAAVIAGTEPVLHDIDAMDVECQCCGSRSWPTEKISCCAHGSLQLPTMPDVPQNYHLPFLRPTYDSTYDHTIWQWRWLL
jgi:hypothetical protein